MTSPSPSPSTTSVLIEPMAESDLEAVLPIDLEAFVPNPSEKEDPRTIRERQLREELARPFGRLRVARDPSTRAVLGYVLFWHVTDEIHLLNVAVDVTQRRRGIGRALVDEVIDYARTHAAAKILLEVRAGNRPAINLYEGLGFSTFNVRERYYFDGEDGLEMIFTTARATLIGRA